MVCTFRKVSSISTLKSFCPAKTVFFFFLVFLRWAMHHVSIYFLGKAVIHFLPREKRPCFRKKIVSFQTIQERSCAGDAPSERTRPEENIIFPCIFFKRSFFIFRLTCKIIFLEKRNIIFPDNTRKTIFWRYFFGNSIFSRRPEIENTVFRALNTEDIICSSGVGHCDVFWHGNYPGITFLFVLF